MTKSGPPSRNGLPRAASRCAVLLAVAFSFFGTPRQEVAAQDWSSTLLNDWVSALSDASAAAVEWDDVACGIALSAASTGLAGALAVPWSTTISGTGL